MSKFDKVIQKIKQGRKITYAEAECILFKFGFELRVKGSHHVFSKMDYHKNVSLKIRRELLPYQIRLLQEVINDHGY